MSLRLITAPTSTPVSVAEVKAWLRVDGTDEDSLITALIEAATGMIEQITGLAIMAQTWELVLDSFADSILLPKGPVTGITSVSYYDPDSALQTLGSSNYALDAVSSPQWLVRAADASWPAIASGVNNVIIRFTAAVTVAADLASLKTAILMLVAHWHGNREAAGDGIPPGVSALLVNHRRYAF